MLVCNDPRPNLALKRRLFQLICVRRYRGIKEVRVRVRVTLTLTLTLTSFIPLVGMNRV